MTATRGSNAGLLSQSWDFGIAGCPSQDPGIWLYSILSDKLAFCLYIKFTITTRSLHSSRLHCTKVGLTDFWLLSCIAVSAIDIIQHRVARQGRGVSAGWDVHRRAVCVAGVLLEPSEQLRKPCEEWCNDVQQLVGGHHLLSVQVDTTEKVVVNVLGTQGFPYLIDTEN